MVGYGGSVMPKVEGCVEKPRGKVKGGSKGTRQAREFKKEEINCREAKESSGRSGSRR